MCSVAEVDRCSECGFEYIALDRAGISGALRLVAAQYRARLVGCDTWALRHRPRPDVWSPLEYAAHVRDVLIAQRERSALALRSNQPTFTSMRPDELVGERRYNDEDPAEVASQIEHAADLLASLLDGLSESEWGRTGIYNWPAPASRDLSWIGRHTVHELVHHLLDITRALHPPSTSASG